jgi:hypothetical protein
MPARQLTPEDGLVLAGSDMDTLRSDLGRRLAAKRMYQRSCGHEEYGKECAVCSHILCCQEIHR